MTSTRLPIIFTNSTTNSSNKKAVSYFAGVYFHAQKSQSFETVNASVPFEVEVLNVGRAFHLSSGIFTAPRSGIYEFSAKGNKHDKSQNNLFVSLRRNAVPVVNAWADWLHERKFATAFSIQALLKLDKGDRVDLFKSEGTLYDEETKQYTHFSGKLLMLD